MRDGSEAKVLGHEPGDDGGAAKLWAVYVSEAEKYDKSLVESWKNDMEGMLIFAGLFSASLTAFLIESYKTLSPDSGEQTIRLLAQISQQLASSSNRTSFPSLPVAVSFTPSASSLVCNALWFISLGLSLSCALIATLLEQWARDFIHRSDTRSAPLIRARIYSYLYYGMKRFNMHAVVDVIPLLLHASLLFFFAGLVAFLIPVNTTMTIITATILCLVTTVYCILTFLPLRFLDCPYRTPLSGAIWRLLQHLWNIWNPGHRPDDTIFEAIARTAGQDSTARQARDYRALVWTVKSLSDNSELEPFVAALADALWDRTEMRPTYADHLRKLANHPELQLRSRINNLYESCYDGITSAEASQRRRMACCKVLWAMASLSSPDSYEYAPVDFSDSRAYHEWRFTDTSSVIDGYTVSAGAMMKWSTFCSLRLRLVEQGQYLARCRDHPERNPNPDFLPITSLFRQLSLSGFHVEANPYPTRSTTLTPSDIPQLLESTSNFLTSAPHTILFEYIRKSAILESHPYQWEVTTNVVSINRLLPFSAFRHRLEWNIEALLHSPHAVWSIPAASGFHWNDTAIAELCSFWRPQTPIDIPPGIIIYLNHRKSHVALERFLGRSHIAPYLWSCFSTTLSHCLSMDDDSKRRTSVDDLLKALWTLTYLDNFADLRRNPTVYEGVLEVISAPEFLQTSSSVVALMKHRILNVLSTWGSPNDARIPGDFEQVMQAVLPSATVIGTGTELTSSLKKLQIEEAKFHILGEFLVCCTTNELPLNAVETLREVAAIRSTGPIHTTHQLRLVNAIQAISESASTDLMNTIIASSFLDVSEKPNGSNLNFQWLEDRQRLGDILSRYGDTLGYSAHNTRRLREIVKQLTTE
ncbi:hypothetical protein B0H16DRAFT_1420516 [Mycena metata]|uniref:DUF6535 domain-containing protein n=1 Tax=Mycena metata TaxID=1033252 RepID=A0AAD7ISU0_9AGAR|nr:hypothetical protein B0H16DRAFT_1420516 [Mycena metata]